MQRKCHPGALRKRFKSTQKLECSLMQQRKVQNRQSFCSSKSEKVPRWQKTCNSRPQNSQTLAKSLFKQFRESAMLASTSEDNVRPEKGSVYVDTLSKQDKVEFRFEPAPFKRALRAMGEMLRICPGDSHVLRPSFHARKCPSK